MVTPAAPCGRSSAPDSPASVATLDGLLALLARLDADPRAAGRGLRFEARLDGPAAAGSTRLIGLREDSRRVEPGELFVARVGARHDARTHVESARSRGAAAVLVDREQSLTAEEARLPVLEVAGLARALSPLAEELYGRPSEALTGVAVTGTNGKTSTAVLCQAALTALGRRTARLGTLGYAFERDLRPGSLTTPPADELSRLLATARAEGASHFVMEASSHALAQHRLDGLALAVAAFTNLTQDHLDFHGTLAEYGRAKARLFTELAPRHAVLNVDDAFGASLAERLVAEGREVLRVGLGERADLTATGLALTGAGLRAELHDRRSGARVAFASRLVGRHNVENLLVCLGIGLSLGLPLDAFAEALGAAETAPGRLERCDAPGDDVTLLVDYAHTPDALERVLGALADVSSGALWCVFGCGGDRDATKRAPMGRAAGRLAARVVLTSDNPRSEAPAAIASAVETGLREVGARYEVELDRRLAIERAVLGAAPGDVVVIAGKGHETAQIIGAETRPFDDRDEARRALAERRRRGAMRQGGAT